MSFKLATHDEDECVIEFRVDMLRDGVTHRYADVYTMSGDLLYAKLNCFGATEEEALAELQSRMRLRHSDVKEG